ncbi:polyketide cyclase [Adhaeribacter soli]|uniref:Polyketide cyclase n=2 Tax=Adhaeribacter soli TaxID=2607655 RepID=A0A5N1IZB7_9BACT|nr:polyketide cyclase [Adhaeribacter soli]
MLIRKPASQVFEAFIDPEITKNFWFTKGSGKLETGKTITWEWEMYGVAANVLVKEILPNEKITVEWDEPATTVEFNFKALSEKATYVTIKNHGFQETGDALLHVIKDATGGFTTVLDGLKAFMEHGINLNLIADKFPKEVMQHP